jgi:hypothetical protein
MLFRDHPTQDPKISVGPTTLDVLYDECFQGKKLFKRTVSRKSVQDFDLE